MNRKHAVVLCLHFAVWAIECKSLTAFAADRYVEVTYAAAAADGARSVPETQGREAVRAADNTKLEMPVTYTIWIPDGAARLRGVIVHQHGCGTGACNAGATAAYDLHWQALARKWDCALLGPSYHQDEKQNC